MTKPLRGVIVGAGYFAQFHYEGWARVDGVEIVGCCDTDRGRLEKTASDFGIASRFADFREMLDATWPDFVDVVTPPSTHSEICMEVAARGIDVMCQKPLAPTLAEARELVRLCGGVRLMVHENFRFQPWHREIKRLLDAGAIGRKLHSLTFRSRPGDGSGADAYLARQPYFQTMDRFLIHETGIHLIDTFRFYAGEVESVLCHLRKLNPVIAGEDCGLLILEFESGAIGLFDANRWNESPCDDPRYTFGELLVEADGGSIRLALDGTVRVQPLGKPERAHDYVHERVGFGGDCCHATLRHFADCLRSGTEFETSGETYLENVAIEEALYRAARERRAVRVADVREVRGAP